MTAPTEAYIAALAQDAYRVIRDRSCDAENAMVCARHGPYLVIVAKGPIAQTLEQGFLKTMEKAKEPKLRSNGS